MTRIMSFVKKTANIYIVQTIGIKTLILIQ